MVLELFSNPAYLIAIPVLIAVAVTFVYFIHTLRGGDPNPLRAVRKWLARRRNIYGDVQKMLEQGFSGEEIVDKLVLDHMEESDARKVVLLAQSDFADALKPHLRKINPETAGRLLLKIQVVLREAGKFSLLSQLEQIDRKLEMRDARLALELQSAGIVEIIQNMYLQDYPESEILDTIHDMGFPGITARRLVTLAKEMPKVQQAAASQELHVGEVREQLSRIEDRLSEAKGPAFERSVDEVTRSLSMRDRAFDESVSKLVHQIGQLRHENAQERMDYLTGLAHRSRGDKYRSRKVRRELLSEMLSQVKKMDEQKDPRIPPHLRR